MNQIGFTLNELKLLLRAVEQVQSEKVPHSEFAQFVNQISDQLQSCVSAAVAEVEPYLFDAARQRQVESLMQSVLILGNKVDGLRAAMQAVADKLDAEDVTNLDSDYRDEIDEHIV